MSNDDQMPPQPKTKEIPAADPVQVLLLKLQRGMEQGFEHVGDRLDRQDKVLERVSGEAIDTNTRMAKVEVRLEHVESGVEDLEARMGRTSSRVRESSQVDLDHESKLGLALAALAEEKSKREALEKTAATKDDVEKMLAKASEEQTAAIVVGVETLMKTPTAQKLKSALVPVLMVAITIIGIKLTMVLNKLQETPTPPTVVQLAAPITVYADAGADR